jgi:hypothetical protein
MERKTAKVYRKELEYLERNIENLKKRISERLLELCKQNPEAPVAIKTKFDGGDTIFAKSINNANYIQFISVDTRLNFIEVIEKYLEEQQPYKQTTIEFNN